MSVLQTFTECAQATQIIYQTLMQGVARNRATETKGITAVDAELFHRLSVSVATLISPYSDECKKAWEDIKTTADLASQFYSVLPPQYTDGVSGGPTNKEQGE